MTGKPPFPPFTLETAQQKARMAENAWNTKDPEKVSLAYTEDSFWRNRSEFIHGRDEILAFLKRKWSKELDYKLIKEVWAYAGTESLFASNMSGTMIPASSSGLMAMKLGILRRRLMRRREASINDVLINQEDRRFTWGDGGMMTSRSDRTGPLTVNFQRHPLPQAIDSIAHLRLFVEHHVFAV